MRNLSKWWKLGALVAVAAVAAIGYVVRSRAFTLIELQYLGPLELLANQTVVVNASNTSTESVAVIKQIHHQQTIRRLARVDRGHITACVSGRDGALCRLREPYAAGLSEEHIGRFDSRAAQQIRGG